MIEYVDSYGLKPDMPLTWGKYNNVHRRLSELLNNTKLRVTYNTIGFQNKDVTIATCGSYAIFRILTTIEMNADLEKNNIILKTLKETNEDKSYDDIVVEFINKR